MRRKNGLKRNRASTEEKISAILEKRMEQGIQQSELERLITISRSYCSELLSGMEKRRIIVRTKSGTSMRVFLTRYFPGLVNGIMRVGMLRSSEYLPLVSTIMAFAEKFSVRLEIVPLDSVPEILRRLHVGSLDLAMAPSIPTISYGLLSGNIKVLGGIASGGSAILSREGGCKNCVLTSASSTMITMVARTELPVEEMTVFTNPTHGIQQFLAGNCCSIAIWEPYLTKLMDRPRIRVESTYSKLLDGFPCCVISTNVPFLAKNMQMLDDMMKTYWLDPVQFLDKESGIEATKIVGKMTRTGRNTLLRSLQDYDFSRKDFGLGDMAALGIAMTREQQRELFHQ